MKNTFTVIGIIILLNTTFVCAYLLGTTQAETITEVQTVTEIKETIPDGYIALAECIPLADVACCFMDGYDYPCFELKDVATQYNMDGTKSYMDIMDELPDETEDFQNNFIDMRRMIDFTATESGLQIYMEDGSGYFWER